MHLAETLRRALHSLKKHWGAAFLGLLALLYLIPYYFVIRQPDPGEVQIYFADRITDAHRILIDRYNQEHRGRVRVVAIDFPHSDFSTNERKEILARSLRGQGDGIDLAAVDIIWMQRFARWCEPLDKYFTPAELNRFLPDALYSCYSDGVLVAMPLDRVQAVMYYREDLLKRMKGGEEIIAELQKSTTWPEFLRIKERLRWTHPFFVFPAAEYEGLICNFTENLLSLNPNYFSDHGFNFQTPEARKVLQLLVDLIQRDGVTPAIVTTFTEAPSYKYFVENDGLFIRGWNSYDKDFRPTPFDVNKERYLRKVPLPHPAGGRPASVVGGWNLMIPLNSTKKEAAVEFMKYLLSESSQEIFYSRGSYYPVITSFYSDPAYLEKYPEIRDLKTLLSTGVHRPPARDYTRYSEIMARYFSLAIRNRMSVDAALQAVTQAIQGEQGTQESAQAVRP